MLYIFLGMDGVDKEKVQRIIYEMSKGSKYFENEERKDAIMSQKIESMRGRCAKLKPADISHYEKVNTLKDICFFVFVSFIREEGRVGNPPGWVGGERRGFVEDFHWEPNFWHVLQKPGSSHIHKPLSFPRVTQTPDLKNQRWECLPLNW